MRYPDATLFTIHDSIATTEAYVNLLERLMDEELARATGFKPKLSWDRWDKSCMDEYLSKLIIKAEGLESA